MCFNFWFCFFSWSSHDSYSVGLESVTAGTKNYKSIFNKNRKKHDKIVLLAIKD